EHADTLVSMNNLAEVLLSTGDYAESERIQRKVVAARRKVLGPEHPDTLYSMCGLAEALSYEGHYTEAEELLRQTREAQIRVLGPEDADTARTTYGLASLTARTGKRDEALSLLAQAVDHGLNADLDLGIEKDADFRSMHSDPRFTNIVT